MKSQQNKFQQQYLWHNIIVEWFNKEKSDLVEIVNAEYCWQLAGTAMDAWHRLNAGNISLAVLEKYFWNKEVQSFLQWANKYKLISSQFNYIEQIPDDVQLINIKKDSKRTNNVSPACFKLACGDLILELNKAAIWAKSEEVFGRVGIIILNLEQIYLEVDYIFSNFLEETEYNISIPRKLNTMPLINIALLILQLANCYITGNNINYEDFSKLLRTKFIAGFNLEFSSRSYMDYLLRKNIDYEFDWQYLINNLQTNNKHANCDIFIKLCNDFEQELIVSLKNKATNNNCKFWVDFCNKILQKFCLGEGCEENLINNWQNLLDQYLQLTNLLGEHDLSIFIKTLRNLSKELNIKVNNNKNINIVNLSLALQLQFDYLWICGCNDIDWSEFSEYSKFNPFVPIDLQKTNQKIYSGEEILQKLIDSTSQLVVCSYPLYIDGNIARCSKLIDKFPEFNINLNPAYLSLEKIQLECYEDQLAPIYRGDLFSGTRFLRLQAACPFQANAKIRLQAENLKSPTSYLEATTKGEILHKTMEQFWFKHKALSEIKKLLPEEIYKDLLAISSGILNNLTKSRPASLNALIIQIEAVRIASLCCNFITNYDLTRSDFMVLYLERKFIVKLKELSIKIKIDRIDQLSDLNLVVIDYKTGKSLINNTKNWQEPRIDDPQLLIYSLCLPNIKELVLAVVTVDPKLITLSNWQESKDIWYENLYKLAKDFQNGVAIVDPKYGAATCRQCDLKYMCRVFEVGITTPSTT